MNEFFDYIMDAVDSCYQDLKKHRNTEIQNPLDLLCGTQEVVNGQNEKKDTYSFQNSFITLTSFVCPVTDIALETYPCDVVYHLTIIVRKYLRGQMLLIHISSITAKIVFSLLSSVIPRSSLLVAFICKTRVYSN